MKETWSRRSFTKTLAVAGTGVALNPLRVRGANNRIRLGFIGLGNRGDQLIDAFRQQEDIEVVALCDLYPPYIEWAARKVGGSPKKYRDYRQVIEQKDVDAVVIGTPDHWHALQMIESCQAGKDVYVEKPLALRVGEGRRMVEAAKKYDRVVQVGIHRRSSELCREAAEVVRSGTIGKVTVARAFHIQNEWPTGIGNPPDAEPPTDWEWDAWLGPAPWKPFNPNRSFYRFRWFYDYSGGQLTNFGTHYLDFIHWALGLDRPEAVTAMGGKYVIEDNREIPDTLEVLWQYPGGTLVTFSQYNATSAPAGLAGYQVEIRGTKGTLYLGYNGYEVVPERIPSLPFPARTPTDRPAGRAYGQSFRPAMEALSGEGDSPDAPHARNFLDCVRSRKKCNCDPETGHRSTTATQIGNVAQRLGAHLQWDGEKERFINLESANDYLNYRYRAPYRLPEV